MMKSNIRQRTFYSNRDIKKAEYRNVIIFQHSPEDLEPIPITKTKDGKEKFTTPAKQVLNDKRSQIYFDLLVKGNFGESDYFITLTYSDKFLPKCEADAEKIIKKYIRELRKEAKGRGETLKYIYVTESGRGRIHHHMLLKNCLPRDLVENLWSRQVRPFSSERERLGWANAKRIQAASARLKGKSPDYMVRISRYMTKEPRTKQGRKKWKQSTNLSLPGTSKADGVCSKKQFDQMSLFNSSSFEASHNELIKYVKRYHKNFVVTDIRREYNSNTGNFYISMQLMSKNKWARVMALYDEAALKELEAAGHDITIAIPGYKEKGVQGVLW